ncbi:MAG TPA: DUF1176 domain-containing protein [Pyrinomonadaceae bacterium]
MRTIFLLFPLTLLAGCASNEETRPPRQTTDTPAVAPAANTAIAANAATPQATAPREIEASATPTAGASYPKKTDPTAEDRQAWRKILKWPDDCEESYAATFGAGDGKIVGLEFYELEEKKYLVEVLCASGAYQGSQVYAFLDETKSPPSGKLLTFQTYESQEEDKLDKIETQELWGLATFDDKTKRLSVLNKFRGPGDCGSLATFGFADGVAELKEFRAKTKCDGKGAGNPEAWKKIALP